MKEPGKECYCLIGYRRDRGMPVGYGSYIIHGPCHPDTNQWKVALEKIANCPHHICESMKDKHDELKCLTCIARQALSIWNPPGLMDWKRKRCQYCTCKDLV